MGRGDTKGWACAIQEPRSMNQTEAREKGDPGTGGGDGAGDGGNRR